MIHWSVTPDSGARIYYGPHLMLTAQKGYELIALARQCLEGRLILPAQEPIEVTCHASLLRLASDLADVAAQQVDS